MLEVSLALLFERNVPKLFWSDAILIDAYLINRMPSKTLRGNSPLQALCPSTPLFQVNQKYSDALALFIFPNIKENKR